GVAGDRTGVRGTAGCGPAADREDRRMSVLDTGLDPTSDQFESDRTAALDSLAPLAQLSDQVLAAGGERAVERHHSRNRLLARERLDLLLDEDAPFLELSCYAGADEPDGQPGGRMI